MVIFPHAGGSPRFYSHWCQKLPDARLWGMTYPGRDGRSAEKPAPSIQQLAAACASQLAVRLAALPPVPVMLFGHSMGAWVAWECARLLEQRLPAQRLVTVVSGQNPPDQSPGSRLHLAQDAALIADINRQHPASRALWEIAELRQLFLPLVREDYRLLETYRAQPGTVRRLHVVYGRDDGEIDPTRIANWQHWGRERCRYRAFPGGHFYLAAPDTTLPRYLSELFHGEV
nr:alpha/beta fold hydrolase [Shimwellia pseudoproteus]